MKLNPKFIDLIKKNEYSISFEDNSSQIYQRLPISSRKYKEIEYLTSPTKTIITDVDSYFDTYKKIASYCIKDFPTNDFDTMIWESTEDLEEQNDIFGLKQIIEASLYRSSRGIAYFRLPSRTG